MKGLLVLFVSLVILFSGCALLQPPEQPAPVQPAPIPEKKVLPDFSVISPKQGGNYVMGDLVVQIETKNFTFATPGTMNRQNQGHFHLYLDSSPFLPCASNKCNLSISALGEHRLKVEMHQNDHSLYEGVAAVSIKFNVIEPAFYTIDYPLEGNLANAGTITVRLTPINFDLTAPGGENQPNQGHFYVYFDNRLPYTCYSTICDVKEVQPGEHTIRVDMRNNDGSLYQDGYARNVTFTAVMTGSVN